MPGARALSPPSPGLPSNKQGCACLNSALKLLPSQGADANTRQDRNMIADIAVFNASPPIEHDEQ